MGTVLTLTVVGVYECCDFLSLVRIKECGVLINMLRCSSGRKMGIWVFQHYAACSILFWDVTDMQAKTESEKKSENFSLLI